MTGVIVLDKPQNFTSFDAVAVLRGLTKEKKTGHTGTLDPMATGVLPLLFGKATKAAALLPDTSKAYRAEFALGQKTDTGDIWGTTVATGNAVVAQQKLEAALIPLRGAIMQLPPMYSAVSVGGQRLYTLARQGIEIPREKRPVTIGQLDLLEFDGTRGVLEIQCSKGTYIRTLIEDMAQAAGTVGTMTALRRRAACGFSLADAYSLEALRELAAQGNIAQALRPVEGLFEQYPVAVVTDPQAARFLNGGALDLQRLKLPRCTLLEGDLLRVYAQGFLGLGRVDFAQNALVVVKHFIEE